MALEGALSALGGEAPSVSELRAKVAFTPQESAEADARLSSPESKADLQKELARTDLAPNARRTLQNEYSATFGSDSGPLSGALAALSDPGTKPTQQDTPTAHKSNFPRLDTTSNASAAGDAIRETGAQMLTGLGASIVGGWRGLAHLATGGSLKDAADIVSQYQDEHTYHPETAGGQALSTVAASPYNPLNIAATAGNWAGGKTTDLLAGKVSPEAAAAAGAAVNTGIQAVPLLLLKGGKSEVFAKPEPGAGASGGLMGTRTSTETTSALPAANDTPAIWRVPSKVPEGVEASPSAASSVVNTLTNGVKVEAPKFAETPQTEGAVNAAVQADRLSTLKRVGLEPEQIRKAALTGNVKEAATDFQQAKPDNAGGQFMHGVLENEREALTNHAQNIVNETGGTSGLTQSDVMARGNTILAPLDALKKYFDRGVSGLYKQADVRAAGVPAKLEGFSGVLDDASNLTNSDRVHLQSGINAYLKKIGVQQEDGSISGTVSQAETIRKYLNENWSPQNSGLVGKLKDALDADVMSSAGEDIYKQARALRTLKAVTLDDPTGISKIMDAEGPEGINRTVPPEKIPDTIASLPVAQFNHIVNVLRNVPKDLQPQAQQALGEIKAHFANKILAAGNGQATQWAAKPVTKFLNANSEKMAAIFTPEELAKFQDLNDAGHYLSKPTSYPGAAVQEYNLLQRGAMGAVRSAGAAAGGTIGSALGPAGAAVGAAAGEMAGGAVAGKIANKATLSAAKARMVRLSDVGK